MWDTFEMIGTIAFAISGALIGIEKSLDLFGISVLAVTTAVGGGIIRDILIGNIPPLVFYDAMYVLISILTAFFICLIYKKINKFKDIILISDAIGLGAFTVTGINIAIQHKPGTLFIMIILGMITGVGGGVLRDIFVEEIPFVFKKEIYALASLIGTLSFYLVQSVLSLNNTMYVCFFMTVVVRLITVKFNIHLPRMHGHVNKYTNEGH